jgi:hypothetical protein
VSDSGSISRRRVSAEVEVELVVGRRERCWWNRFLRTEVVERWEDDWEWEVWAWRRSLSGIAILEGKNDEYEEYYGYCCFLDLV